MTMKKFLSTLFAATLVITISCGKGKEAAKDEDEGEDDQVDGWKLSGRSVGVEVFGGKLEIATCAADGPAGLRDGLEV